MCELAETKKTLIDHIITEKIQKESVGCEGTEENNDKLRS